MNYEIELKAGGLEVEVKGWRGLVTLTGLLLLGAAIYRELSAAAGRKDVAWHALRPSAV